MKLDISTTLNRINKIKEILSKENTPNLKDLAKRCNLPESTTSLYINNYLKDVLNISKNGRDKKISLIKNKTSNFENNLLREKNKINRVIDLRKKGLTYSEIKTSIRKDGLNVGNGTLSNYLKEISIENKYLEKYHQRIRDDRINAGKKGGKIRV